MIPCPFCNSEPRIAYTDQKPILLFCASESCPIGHRWITIKDWHKRPIEDTLRKENADLREKLITAKDYLINHLEDRLKEINKEYQ